MTKTRLLLWMLIARPLPTLIAGVLLCEGLPRQQRELQQKFPNELRLCAPTS
jgi:hypothetical protein